MVGMRHASPDTKPAAIEVPAFEADGNLLALLPREALAHAGGSDGKDSRRHARADFKVVIVGENQDFSILAAEIKGAWRRRETPGGQSSKAGSGRPSDELVTYLIAAANPGLDHGAATAPFTALIARFGRALRRATSVAGEDLISKALEQSTDIGALVQLLRSTAPLLSAEQEIEPQLVGKIASLEAEDALIQQVGGLKDAKWVGAYLSINPKSVAAKARRNELLAITRGDRNLYPAFQFRNGGVLPGIREILEVLPLTNGWSRLSFLLSPDPGLDDRSPIDAFASDPDAALELARNADVQGAA